MHSVLALQRAAGNRAVAGALSPVQRCGGEVHPGCSSAEEAATDPGVARVDLQRVGSRGAPSAPPGRPPASVRVHDIPSQQSPFARPFRPNRARMGLPLTVFRQELDAGTGEGPHDASLPGGTAPAAPSQTGPDAQSSPAPGQSQVPAPEVAPPPRCTTSFVAATTSFQRYIALLRAAEARLTAAGITSTEEQIHALRGIYNGTDWSLDFRRSTVRPATKASSGSPTRPKNPDERCPPDVRPLLDCGLFAALRQSQDVVDGGASHGHGSRDYRPACPRRPRQRQQRAVLSHGRDDHHRPRGHRHRAGHLAR